MIFVVLLTNTFEEMNHPHLLHFPPVTTQPEVFILELSMFFFPTSNHVVIGWEPSPFYCHYLYLYSLSSVGV